MKKLTYLSIAFAFLFITTLLVAQPPVNPLNGPYGGNVTSLVVQGNTMFAGMWPGGVYRSTDEGLHWQHMDMLDASYGNVVTMFADNQNVFAATWEGLFQSSDAGNTWHKRAPKYCTAVAALSSGYIAIASGDTVMVSDATGQTWTKVHVFTPATMGPNRTGIFTEGDTVYLGSKDRGIYKSYDGGHTWVARNNGFVPGSTTSFIKKNNRMYVSSNTGIYFSDDRGAGWTVMTTNGLLGCLNVECVFNYNDSLFSNAGFPVVYSSAWDEWVPSNMKVAYTACYAELNGRLFCAGYDGVSMMQQDFNHWERRCNGLAGSNPIKVLVDGQRIWVNKFGVPYQSPDGGNTWSDPASRSNLAQGSQAIAWWGDTLVATGGMNFAPNLYFTKDTFRTYTNISDTDNMYVTGAYYLKSQNRFLMFVVDSPIWSSGTSHLLYSDNWGATWHPANGLPVAAAAASFLEAGPDLYMMYTYPQQEALYKSVDNGINWVKIANYPHPGEFTDWTYVNGTTYIPAFYDGVMYSPDRGANWYNIILPSFNDVLLSIKGVNNEVYGLSPYGLFKLNQSNHLWDQVATRMDPSLQLSALYVQGNRLLITNAGGPMCYYDVAGTNDVPEVLKAIDMSVYPNPSAGVPVQLIVSDEMKNGMLEVFDIAGKLVYQSTLTGTVTNIPVSSFSAGTYLAKVRSDKKEASQKFIIE